MANTTAQATQTGRELANILSKWLPTMVTVESVDSDGNPVVTISQDATPVAGEKVMVIRVKPIEWALAADIFNNTATIYGPHVLQLCTEKNYEGATDSVLDILGPAELLPVLGELCRRGSTVEWYRTANLTVPSTAAMTAANLGMTFRPLYNNVMGTI